MQRLTAVGFIRAVLAVELAVTALPVGDAVERPATQELTPTATGGEGWGTRGLGGYWSQRHRIIGCCHRNTECHCGDSYLLLFLFSVYLCYLGLFSLVNYNLNPNKYI